MEPTFKLLLLLGIGALIAGLLRARLNWRDDVPPFSRQTGVLELLVHPERYAKVDAVSGIRLLNGMGVLFLAGAVAVLVHEAVAR